MGLATGQHAAAINGGRPGVLHGNRTYLLQDGDGQITEAHSISAGLDYPGIGPEHAFLHDVGRVDLPVGHRRRDGGGLPAAGPRWRASCRRWSPPTPWPASATWRERSARTASSCSDLSGRGDKDLDTVAGAAWDRQL